MGKFDGIMLCSDLDGTLLDSGVGISERNREAIEYFKSEGGKFTFVTGRAPRGAVKMAEKVKPNMPSVLYNGAGIYDFGTKTVLWGAYLDDRAIDVVRLVEKNFRDMGLIVCTEDNMYYDKPNRCLRTYYQLSRGEATEKKYEEIEQKWKKALIIIDSDDVEKVRQLIAGSEYAGKYSFMQSSPYYYEILPPNISKASALRELIRLCGIKNKRIVCVGDGENDALMLKNADLGIAVSNAMDCAKEAADIVLEKSNDEDALAEIIENIL